MKQPIFITGTGTDIGKTVVASVITEALGADYWKPVQAGFDTGTDALRLQDLLSNSTSIVHPELYKLSLPASPHIAAKKDGVRIDLDSIIERCGQIIAHSGKGKPLVIEGAGGLMVPLNDTEFISDLITRLNARVILVSRNYLGSINHSLLTAFVCKVKKMDVAGWIFNDEYMDYENEIAAWTGIPMIASLPFSRTVDSAFVREEAIRIKPALDKWL